MKVTLGDAVGSGEKKLGDDSIGSKSLELTASTGTWA